MRWLCLFFPHKWVHIFNCRSDGRTIGIWQCRRCKEISKRRLIPDAWEGDQWDGDDREKMKARDHKPLVLNRINAPKVVFDNKNFGVITLSSASDKEDNEEKASG